LTEIFTEHLGRTFGRFSVSVTEHLDRTCGRFDIIDISDNSFSSLLEVSYDLAALNFLDFFRYSPCSVQLSISDLRPLLILFLPQHSYLKTITS